MAHVRHELGLQPRGLLLLLVRTTLGEITCDLAEAAQLALLVTQRGDHHVRPEARAVLAHPPTLILHPALRLGGRELPLGLAGFHVLRRVEDREMLADDLLGSISLDAL